MKKKLLVTTGLLLTLVPSLIRADNVFPSTLSYKAVITNKNGFKCDTYDNKDITIPFGSIVSVRESYYDSNLELEIVDYADTKCNNKISLNDIKIYNDEFNINDYLNAGEYDSVSKFDKVNNAVILSKNGVKMYKGPSLTYSTITTIPYNTSVKTEYYIDPFNTLVSWISVTYNGKKGWINTTNYEVMYNKTNEKAIVISKNSGINENTIVNEYYNSAKKYYVKYNDKYILVDKIAKSNNGNITIKSNKKIYDSVNSSKEIDSVSKGTKLSTEFFYSDSDNECYYYYVKHDNKSGWIKISYGEQYDFEKVKTIDYSDKISIESIKFNNEIKLNDKLNIDFKLNNDSDVKVLKVTLIFKDKDNQIKETYLNDIDTTPYINIDTDVFNEGEYTLDSIDIVLDNNDKTKLTYSVDDVKTKNDYKVNVLKNDKIDKDNKDNIDKYNNKSLLIGLLGGVCLTVLTVLLIVFINNKVKSRKN